MQPRIVTVLKTGGEYLPEHVARLRAQCAEHAAGVPFLCLTDSPEVPNATPLTHSWRGWWAKMEALKTQGPILYLDLDTTVCGALAPLLEAIGEHDFIALRNPYDTPSKFGSGVMGWRGSMQHVYDRFADAPTTHMRRCTTPRLHGDQGFIAETETPPAFWQDLFPGQIVSWKVECQDGVPPGARIVYFHGEPKPWSLPRAR